MEKKEWIIADNLFESSDNAFILKGKTHYHNNYEIYYLTEGDCRYFVATNTYKVTSGDIVLIPPGVIHNTTYENTKRSRILLNLSESFIPEPLKDKIDRIHYFKKNPATHNKIKELFESIENEYYNQDDYSDYSIKCKIWELLILLMRNYKSDTEFKSKNTLVEKTVNYIQNNYASDISLAKTAEYCFVSKEHLSRTFKKETGFGFREFLNIYRLKKADTVLKSHPEFKIVDVALCCGFNDSNYFSKLYKQMYNSTPKKAAKKDKSDRQKLS